MSTHTRPWLQCVKLHPDVLSDDFSEDIFALDLGTLSDYLIGKDLRRSDRELGRVPAVYRDADSFFAASYLTSGLKSLLEDVLGRLAGAEGNRVLRLQTPFGGGKSHTLAALLHAARSRSALDVLPEAIGLPRPEGVRVAVVDGQFFDPTNGKRVPGQEITARTVWGWIAWALGGPEGYELVRAQDEARVAPGGDALIEMLKGGPSLILLDELLQYLISAGGIRVEQTTLRDETLSFLQRLTAAVGSVEDAVLAYSLQSSKRESLEYTNLLQIVEHLAARKDQRREPVEGNEILNVIQRRLLAGTPDASAAAATADTYGQVFTQMRRAYAQGDADRLQAEEEGLALRERIKASYPFHPALIDLMRERWAAVPDFQRTRGALRFLASCLRAAHRAGGSRPLLGPGDVPVQESDVRLAFFKEVGQREDFQACLEHDFIGANARARRIDERRAREVTTEAGKQPATRLATTVLLYSFGGLRRGESDQGDLLPPGIVEPDLLGSSIGPDLDTTTIQACLKELKEQCLYLHFDGVRYCFKKWREHNLTDAQRSQLKEREATEKHAAESALLKLYGEVWLPSSDGGKLALDPVSMGGRPLQTTLDEKRRALIHQRLTELLTIVQRRVFGTVAPGKITELFRLGEVGTTEFGIATDKVVSGFFSFLGFPRLLSDDAVRKAITRGVATGLFGYTTGRPALGDDGRYQLDRSRVVFERNVADDEIDLDSGFLMVVEALPLKPVEPVEAGGEAAQPSEPTDRPGERGGIGDGGAPYDSTPPTAASECDVALTFTADREAMFGAWNALANLADLAGKVTISATATADNALDKGKLENGVLEPLRELGLIDD